MRMYYLIIVGLLSSMSGGYGQNTAPTDLSLNVNTIIKNTAAGSVVGKLTAVDDSLGVLMAWGDNTYGKIGDGTADYASSPIKFSDGFVFVEGGYTHDLGIKADGSLWAWGDNSWGQLGNGTQIEATQPIKIGDGYTSAVCNSGFSLAIKSDGSLWAWGFNGYSQLGDGSTVNRLVPYKVGDGYVSVSAGYQHVIALKSDGSLWAWGDNSKGQLGDGTTINRSIPTKIGDGYEKINAADNSSFGIKQDGNLFAWGVNSSGQLGLGNKTDVQYPTLVGDSFTSVSGGITHTLAVKIDGSLWAWGDNQRGQLGNGTNISITLPAKIGDGYRMVSAGQLFSLFLDQSGRLFSSGYNAKGQLGDGSTVDSYSLKFIGGGYLTLGDIDAGQYALAISSDGGLWTWGRLRANIDQFKTLPVIIGKDYTMVAVGQDHSLGLKSDGSVWAWGDNTYGQLGIGSTDTKSVPIKVGLGYTAIAAGGACSLALKDGKLYVWGNNSAGLLGVTGNSILNVPTNTGLEFVSIAAGGSFFLGIKSDGSLWTWGQNYVGQLGDGTTISKTIPVKVGDGFAKIIAGGTHALALKTDGSLWAWGDNSYGQVGDGTTENKLAPVKIGDGFSVIAAGQYQSFGIKSDGTFWSWGSNSNGALGDGTFNDFLAIPTKNDDGFSDVSGGQFCSFGIKIDGSLWAWGLNSRGSFGNSATGTSVSRTKVKVADGYVATSTYNHTLGLRSIRFSLVNGVGSDDNNSFRIERDQLKTVILVDGSKSSYSVRIRATDYSGLFFEKQLQIQVSDFSPEPTQQPTSLSFSSVTTTSFSIGYAASASNPTGYLMIRKTNSYPTTDPSDGIVYTAGASVGDGQVVYVGNALSVNESTLSSGTVYYYKVYAYNGSGTNINYLQINPLTGFQSTIASAPTAQPTSITFNNVSESSITVNYSAATGTTSGYLAIRKVGSSPTSFPLDGTIYQVGDALGDGTIAYSGSAVSFSDLGLSSATVFYYKIYSYNGTGSAVNYLQLGPLTGSQSTSGSTNTAPTNILLSATSITENLASGTTVGTLTATDTQGGVMTYALVTGTGDTDNISFTISGSSLKSAVIFDYEIKSSYSIRIKVTDSGSLTYEKQFTITIIDDPTDPTFEPTAQPTSLSFSNVSTSSMTSNYTAATGSPSGYLVVRKAGALPTFVPVDGTSYADGAVLSDGSVAYNRSGVSFNDTGLASGTTYYYQIYSYNGSGTSINYLQASPLSGSKATAGINSAPTDINLSASSITENQAIGTTIGTLSATDAEGGTMSYTLVAGTGDTNNASFTISGTSLQSAIVFDYETKSSYSVRIRVTDSGGLTLEKQFTITIIDDPTDPTVEPVAQPTNLSFTNISISSITLNYSAANGNPSSYLIVRKAAALATFVPVDGTAYADGAALSDGSVAYNRSSVSFNDTGLTSGITYYYQIYSYNGSGTSINYLQESPLSKSQATSADTTPPQISNTTIANQAAGTPVTVSVTVTDAESAVSSVVLSYGSSGAAAFSVSNSAMTQSGTSWSYTIPGSAIIDPGVRYRITAQNAVGLSTVLNYDIGISYSGTGLPIPYTQFGTKQENYRIIAIPLTLPDNSVNAIFGNALGVYGDINKWRMFHYSGGSTNELSGISQLERGKGYWLIASQSASLTTGAGSTSSSLDKPTSILLTNGWNQIGNPYTYRLVWADIQAANPSLSMTNTLLVFRNGKLENGTALDSFEGGFIFVSNVTSGTSLIFPAERKNGRVEPTRSPSRPEENEVNWEINFELSNGKRTFDAGGFGMYEDGADGFDGYDDFTPPRWGEYLELNHHKNLHQTAYTRDVISTKESHTWEFEVNSSEPEAVHSLTWQPGKLRLAPEKRLVLWDVMRSRPVNMLTQQEVNFTMPARFKVIYGDEDYIKRETTTSHFILHPPFPNPNKGKVTVSFQVPDEQDGKGIVLELFDPSGKSIQRVDQFFASGYHEVTWELASQETQTAGVYLTKLTTASGIYIQKIIVIP